jgi:uncharacterized protein YeaO (DUF488 family)
MEETEMKVKAKRVYEDPEPADGMRILVDRLWPRGLTKERARVDLWLRDIAPSTELRKRFAHDPRKWNEFCRLYLEELKDNALVEVLRSHALRGMVTLLYAARDVDHNEAVVLLEVLKG